MIAVASGLLLLEMVLLKDSLETAEDDIEGDGRVYGHVSCHVVHAIPKEC
jgi:hypothetical protein